MHNSSLVTDLLNNIIRHSFFFFIFNILLKGFDALRYEITICK